MQAVVEQADPILGERVQSWSIKVLTHVVDGVRETDDVEHMGVEGAGDVHSRWIYARSVVHAGQDVRSLNGILDQACVEYFCNLRCVERLRENLEFQKAMLYFRCR